MEPDWLTRINSGESERTLMCSQQVRDTLSSCRRSGRTTALRVGCPAVEHGARAFPYAAARCSSRGQYCSASFCTASDEGYADGDGGETDPEQRLIASRGNMSGLFWERLEEERTGLLIERSACPEKEIQCAHCGRVSDIVFHGVARSEARAGYGGCILRSASSCFAER